MSNKYLKHYALVKEYGNFSIKKYIKHSLKNIYIHHNRCDGEFVYGDDVNPFPVALEIKDEMKRCGIAEIEW